MSEPRVKAEIWVRMALRLGDIAGRPGAMLRRGDRDAGGILVVLRGPEGLSVLAQFRGAAGEPAWMRATGREPVTEDVAQAYLARQVKRDPDLWIIEFPSPDLLPPFAARILP